MYTTVQSKRPSLRLDFALSNHDLGDKVDDGGGGLLGVELGKQMARVVGHPSLLAGHESKDPEHTMDTHIINRSQQQLTDVTATSPNPPRQRPQLYR